MGGAGGCAAAAGGLHDTHLRGGVFNNITGCSMFGTLLGEWRFSRAFHRVCD